MNEADNTADDIDILKNPLDYYRAHEYNESVQQIGRFAPGEPGDPLVDAEQARIRQALHRLPPERDVLELACGTGIWTRENKKHLFLHLSSF